jgi:hypothetical protein
MSGSVVLLTVNIIISFRGTTDDDFDTDFGYSGAVQFGISFKDSSTTMICLGMHHQGHQLRKHLSQTMTLQVQVDYR